MRRLALSLAIACGLAIAGCAEGEQGAGGIKHDAPPWSGITSPQPLMAAGWKAGDRASWEQHMKVRTQGGQNEYATIK